MISELEALYKRLDEMQMTEADRHAAKASLAQAEALASFLAALTRWLGGVRSAPALRNSDRPAQASS